MTEKRYTIGFDGYTKNSLILENEEFFCRIHHIDKDKIIDRLNEQDKSIKELEREKKSFMDDAIKFEKECKRLYNNLRLTNSDLCSEKIIHNHCKKENEQLKQQNRLLENTIESLTEQLAHGIEDLMGDVE